MRRVHPSLILLVVSALAYGLLIPRLGFYWDDLPMSWVRYQLGPEAMTRYFSTNRPVWGLLYQLTTRLLPHVPVYWQLFALAWRWIGAVVLWAIMRRIWPDRAATALTASLMFLLYPGFNQQWVSYLYTHFFIVLACLLGSFYLMLRGGTRNTILALVLSAFNLWMLEYFFVLELARPVLLWFHSGGEALERGQRLRQTFRRWAPYLALFVLAVLSRLFIFNNQIYGFGFKGDLARQPLNAALGLVRDALSSLWTSTAAAWAQMFQPPDLVVDGPRTLLIYVVVVLCAVAVTVTALRAAAEPQDDGRRRTALHLIVAGVVMLLLAGPAFWLTDVPVSLAFPASRALLSFAPGASLLLTGLIQLLPGPTLRRVVVASLVGLMVGRQFLWSNSFRRDWEQHRDLFWQMTWRAPAIEPGTIVLTNQVLEYYADNSLGASLNWIFAPDNHTSRVDYVLFFPTNRIGGSLPVLRPDVPIQYDYIAGWFEGNTSNTLAFYYDPPGCLRLLDPEIDTQNRLIPFDGLMRQAAELSDASKIRSEVVARLPAIYGPEPLHRWCYYFQRAELARQLGNWTEAARLGDEALRLDDYPNDPVERFVFIEAYAHAGEWERAAELTRLSYRVSEEFVGPLLCTLWDRIQRETVPDEPQQRALAEIREQLPCP